MINSNIDIEYYSSIFAKDRVVAVKNFLNTDYANTLHEYFSGGTKSVNSKLSYLMPDSWWNVSVRSEKLYKNYPNTPANQAAIDKHLAEAAETFDKGGLAFNFKRTLNSHVKTCDCPECKVIPLIQRSETIELISKITGIPLTESKSVFISCYEAGSYLSIHTDQGNGKIAFVLNLTKGWRPQYGGNLHILGSDWTQVNKVLVPSFNTLVMFEVPKNGVPHYVSHVSPGVTKKRLAISGWCS